MQALNIYNIANDIFIYVCVHMIPYVSCASWITLWIYLRYHNITSDIIIPHTTNLHNLRCTTDLILLCVVSMHAHVCMYIICIFLLCICTVFTPHSVCKRYMCYIHHSILHIYRPWLSLYLWFWMILWILLFCILYSCIPMYVWYHMSFVYIVQLCISTCAIIISRVIL